MFLRLSATPGSEQTLPREAPARRVVHRRPFFRRQIVGLLCGKGVEPPRGRGRPSGARESQVFFGYIITKVFSKIHLDITTTTTEEHYIIKISRHSTIIMVSGYCFFPFFVRAFLREAAQFHSI